ncbi:unnamed protein product, partial [Meganyctiphanes norvegica]
NKELKDHVKNVTQVFSDQSYYFASLLENSLHHSMLINKLDGIDSQTRNSEIKILNKIDAINSKSIDIHTRVISEVEDIGRKSSSIQNKLNNLSNSILSMGGSKSTMARIENLSMAIKRESELVGNSISKLDNITHTVSHLKSATNNYLNESSNIRTSISHIEEHMNTSKLILSQLGELIQNRTTKIACTVPWVFLEGSGCFLFIKEECDWDSARSKCKMKGADLAILNTQTKRNAVATFIGSAGNGNIFIWWIGGNDRSGQWLWIDGKPITEGWHSTEWIQPNHDDEDNTCLHLQRPAQNGGNLWDFRCDSVKTALICEK